MQKFFNVATFAFDVNTVIFCCLGVLLEADYCGVGRAEIAHQRIEKQGNVARKKKHTVLESAGNACHCHHKHIKKRCRKTVKVCRNGAEQLAECAVLRGS